MKKPTIAELRAKEVTRLAYIIAAKTPNADGCGDIARNFMNRYYRLAGMCDRLLYLENDEHTANTRYTAELKERREKLFEKLNADFERYAGLMLIYYSWLPTIADSKGGSDIINRYFYNWR